MENFIKAMLKAKVNYKNEQFGMRIFNHIHINTYYSLSIQCSEAHYCTPRKLTGLKFYETFELAIIFNNEITDNASILEGFERKNELEKYDAGGVYGYVPKDLIEDLYNYLNK